LDLEERQGTLPQIESSRAAEGIWDVAIVGAGPAGATAAIHAARRGHRVLLLDKSSFPRDKVCGDGLIPDAIRALERAGLAQRVREAGLSLSAGIVYSPSRVQFAISGQFLTVKRYVLDRLIVGTAITSGAVFCSSRVCDLLVSGDGTLLLKVEAIEKPIRCRIAIIATGASVELASKVGAVMRTGPSAVALRCYVRSPIVLDRLIISYDRSIAPGYAWIFPLAGGEFNVGCGVTYRDPSGPTINLRKAFHQFVTRFPLAREIMGDAETVTPLTGAMLRCGMSGTHPVGPGNVLVIGETIGTTFPFTGEGIGKAMETGELAAEIANEALESSDFSQLDRFPQRLESELRPKFLAYQIAEDWFSKPWLNDFVARRISRSRFLQRAVEGLVNETVDPRQIFSLRGILRSFVS
jgi:geranylgeranyl reductase family protein